MTTERQKRANAANAAKSTGPRTAEGRATSASNARKHGLNSAPPWDEVRSYLYLITGSAQIESLILDAPSRAARDLAEAEARLARCLMAERRHLIHMAKMVAQQPPPMADDIEKGAEATEEAVAFPEGPRRFFPVLKIAKKEKVKPPPDPNRPEALRQRLKTLMRYRREAEAQRCKALKRWLAIQPAGDKTNKEEFAHL